MPSNPTRSSTGKRRLNRQGPAPLALEQRLVFDGAAGAEAVAQIAADHPATADATDTSADHLVPAAVAPAATDSAPATSIVFVDGQLPNAGVLASNIASGARVVVLDPNGNALQQIQDAVAGRNDIQSIHILSHGSQGDITLGNLHLNQSTLAAHADALTAIGSSLTADGDILIYGCDIGAGSDGKALVDEIARITQADVAASTDATGATKEGGDWTLEYTTGTVEAASLAFADSVDPFLLGVPTVSSVDDTTYVEGSGPVVVDNNITITGGSSYDGQYVRFSLTNGQSTDILTLTNAANVNASGAISYSGSSVYLGNGSGRDVIGTIDATENGTAGKALKITFVSTFTNSGFESGSLTGWTAMNQVVNLGTTSIAGFTAPNDGTYTANAGNDDVYPTTPGSFTTTIDTSQYSEGTHSLRLLSSGMTTATGYDVVHGPAVYSDAFSATAGDKIYFDWRAFAGGDAFDVYGYILNTATGATTKVLDETGTSTGASTNWATASATIPTNGSYRFVFVAGTYDFSGGRAAGASLYIDNVRVFGSKVTDAVVTNIARQVAFNATSDSPVTSPVRVFTVTAMSATGSSASDTGLINVTPTNDAPVLAGTAQTLAYTENAVATPIDTVMTVTDPDSPANLNGGWLQAEITTNGAAEDQLSVLNQGTGAGQIGVSGSNVTYGGTVIGTIDASNTGANGGALRINLNSSATLTAVQALGRVISYANTSDTPSTASRTVTYTVNDGGNTGSGGALQGTRTATINLTAVDDPAVLSLSRSSSGYDENDGSFYVDSALTLTDVDSTTLSGARVVITSNLISAEDRLQPASGTDVSGKITYAYNTSTGILTLSGTATIAEYQAALRAVKYYNISENPTTTARTISMTIGNALALSFGGKTHYYEYVSGSYTWSAAKTAAEGRSFQGMTGYLATITSQEENDFIKQKLAADAWIGASDDYSYINAATGATTFANQTASEGKWYWVTGPEKGSLISTGNGSPVTASGGYAYWNSGEPNNSGSTEHYGEIYSSGSSPGKWNDLPNSALLPYVVEYSDNGGTPTFSKTIAISPVRKNDAPVNNAPSAIAGIQEDAVNNSGSLVSSFLSSTDVDGNSLGIAVTATDNSHGTWQYSTDNGAIWTAFGTPSDASARLLRSTDMVRFVPAADFAGTATITYRAWDRTGGTAGSTVDLSAASSYGTTKAVTNGDETAFSASKQTASITVAAVNDAPVLSAASPTLATLTEDQTNDGGQSVAAILGASVSDVDSGAASGIAVTNLSAGNGKWQYSLNAGSSWTDVGTVSASSALLLRSADLLRFVPDGKNATAGSITYKAWDQTGATAGQQGTKVSTAVSGGTSPFSTASDTAGITVTAVNDAPVLGTPANLAGLGEDASGNAGQTVGSLLGSAMTDVDTGAVQGIAVTATTNGGATGAWQYSTDGGTTWFSVGTPSASTALLLKSTDRVRFNPDGFKGGTPTLTLRGWDQTTGTATNGATRGEADVATNGGTAAFSASSATINVAVADVNDAPEIVTAASNATFTENLGPVAAGSGLVIRDDSGQLSKAVVSISTGFTAGDTLAVTVGASGISASYNGSTGVLTLTGTASAAAYQTVLNTLTYTTASEDPTINSASRTLRWSLTDTSNLTGTAGTSSITVVPTVDAPTLSAALTLTYTEDDGLRILSPALSLSDADDSMMAGARVLLSGSGLDNTKEYLTLRDAVPADVGSGVLGWTQSNVLGFTGVTATYSWNSTDNRGELVISGIASNAAYQQILRTVGYGNNVDYTADPDIAPTVGTRNIDWQTIDANSDGVGADSLATFLGSGSGNGSLSNLVTQTITLINANEAPQVSGANIALPYSEGDTIKILANAIVPSDDNADGMLSAAQVQVTAGLTVGDSVAVAVDSDASDGFTHTVSGSTVSLSWDSVSASKTVIGDGITPEVQTLTNLPALAAGQSYTLTVGALTLSSGPLGASPTVNDLITAFQTDPLYGSDYTLSASGYNLVLTWVVPGPVPDTAVLASGTTIHETITALFDSTGGVLSLTGNASIAAYQSVLRSVTFSNITNDDPTATSATRSVQWRVFDSNGTPSAVDANATTVIQVTAVNDKPVFTADTAGTYAFTEGAPAILANAGLSLSDPDDTNLTGATVAISGGSVSGDLLAIDAGVLSAAGLSLDAASTSTSLVLTGTASLATYESVLRQVKFSSSSDDPTAATRTLSWTVTDDFASRLTDFPGGNNGSIVKETSTVATSTISVIPVNDAPTISGLPGSAVTYTEGATAATLAGAISLADVDDANLTEARVWISGGFTTGDTLAATVGSTGIVASYNAATGLLTLTHAGAPKADFESVLQSVKFSSTSADPTALYATRSISWQVTDADVSTGGADKLDSSVGTTTVAITASDNAGALSGLTSETYVEKGSAVPIAPNLTLSDPDDTTLDGLTVTLSGGRTAGDLLTVTAPLTGTGISLVAYDPTTGVLTLTGTASLADYQTIARSIVFSSSSDNPTGTSTTRSFTWGTTSSFGSRLTDADGSNNGASGTVATGAGSNTLSITGRNDAPTLTFGHNNSLDGSTVAFEQGGTAIYALGPISASSGDATITDPDDAYIASATVAISNNLGPADVLSVATPSGWSRVGSVLTTGSGAQINVAYNAGTGTLSLTTASGNVTKAEFESVLEHVQYQNASLSPTATGASRALTWTITDANAVGDGALSATGTSYLVIRDKNDAPTISPATPSVTYTEGALTVALPDVVVTDPDPDEIVTATLTLSNPAAGQLSIPTGAAYNAGTGVWTITGIVTDVNAALAALQFVPTTNNDVDASISISVADGGEDSATPATGSIALHVNAVNDAPLLTPASPVLAPLTEDDTANAGQTVASFRGAIADVDSGTQPGIVITATDNGNGHWEYRIGSGSWTSIGSLSDSAALVLADADLVRFVPDGANATTASLTYRAWDGTGATAGGTVDASLTGNATPFSSAYDQASIAVSAVNDAPVLAVGDTTLSTLNEDAVGNTGHLVSSLRGATTDADTGAVQGLAITSLSSGNGRWQYSTNGGTTWTNADAGGAVSATHALLLRDTDHIRFVPNGENATTASFDYRAWDQTGGTAGGYADTSANGGTTAFSSQQNAMDITVTAVNDAPLLAPATPILNPITEDDTANPGQTVASFIGSTVSDVDSGAATGIAITATNDGNGHWQYSTDGGTTWTTVSGLNGSNGLLLADTDKIRFVPNAENTTSPTFSYRAWDRTVGTAGSLATIGATGSTSAYSTGENTAAIVVGAVNDAPINDVAPTYSGDFREDGTLRQDGVITADPGLWHDVDAGDPATAIRYQWQVADDASGTGLRDIDGATLASYKLTAGDIGKFVRAKVFGGDGKTETVATSGFTRVSNADPRTVGTLDTQDATESVPMSFTVPAGTFADANGEDTLYYSATLADGSPLPAWLHFDPVTRTFSGTPGGGDIAVLQVRVSASDHGNQPTSADFTLRVAGVPVKPIEAKPDPEPAPPIPVPASAPPAPAVTEAAGWSLPTSGVGSVGGSWSAGRGDGFFGPTDRGLAIGGLATGTEVSRAAPGTPPMLAASEPRNILPPAPQVGLTRSDGFQIVVQQTGQTKDEVSLTLARPLIDQDFKPANTIKFNVPPDTFSHTRLDARIDLSASLLDGSTLPNWLRFDARKGEFRGIPPSDFDGDLEVKVTAKDNFGNTVSTIFRIRVHAGQRVSFNGRDGLSAQFRTASAPGRDALRGGLAELARQARQRPA